MQLGEFVQERSGLGLSGQDAADRCQREGTEADGTFQGSANVVALVVCDECQQVLRL